jgi:hypothetical protein
VVETLQGNLCWVRTTTGAERRSLQLGDTNDVFTIVEAGLQEGDEVLLHPFAFKEARALAIEQRNDQKPSERESTKSSESQEGGKKPKPPDKSKKQMSKPQGLKLKKVETKSNIK